ncbi:hypothetical protein [Streptomyces sp. t39]|uniref:hypothetical protein n=1 Tax=Streptomyces sp. t39 TaxID=1828156 RepID=UPI0011CE4597|nr:hypothetical protein [Streptomyces sp. t39]
MTRTIPAPASSLYDDMEDEDNRRGPEPEDFHRLVRHLVADGDARAALAGRRARRTLAQMGATR